MLDFADRAQRSLVAPDGALQPAASIRRASSSTGRGPRCRCTSFTPEGRNAAAHPSPRWRASDTGLLSTCSRRDTPAHQPGSRIGCERRLDSSAATLTSSNLRTRRTANFPGTVWRATRLRRDNHHGRSLAPGQHTRAVSQSVSRPSSNGQSRRRSDVVTGPRGPPRKLRRPALDR